MSDDTGLFDAARALGADIVACKQCGNHEVRSDGFYLLETFENGEVDFVDDAFFCCHGCACKASGETELKSGVISLSPFPVSMCGPET